MRVVAIIQARTGSTRLPDKVLADVLGRLLLLRVVERARLASSLHEVVVATSSLHGDRRIVELCDREGIRCFTGSESDVLDRYRRTARATEAQHVVRLTGDCPLLDPVLVDRTVALYAEGGFDYAGIASGAGAARLDGGRFPSGFDAEVFSTAALERAWSEASEPSDREHVTPYLWRTGLFRTARLRSERDLAHYRCSVDTLEDLELVRAVYAELGEHFSYADVIALLDAQPELAALNAMHVGREGHEQVWTPGTASCAA